MTVSLFICQLEKRSKIYFCKMKYFQFGACPFSFLCTFGTGRRQNTILLHSISFFCSSFFPSSLKYPQNINGTFLQWGFIQKKKGQRILKIRVLLLFLMLETELICQIGCSIRLWFQHNGEIINRIMDGKQEVLHVCFSPEWFPDFTG